VHFLSDLIIGVLQQFTRLTGSYGASIIFFAVALKLTLLPITLYGMRWQERFKQYFKKAKAEIAALETVDKARRDDQILDIYQANGINFTNQCKALLPLLIQIPLLVAFYRTVTTWEVMGNAGFLWIQDLSQVDNLIPIGVALPWFGSSINALPFALLFVNSFEVILFRDENTSLKSFTLPLVFFLLFYPFPSSCMLFWVTLNIVHIPERFYFTLKHHTEAYGNVADP